MTLLKIPEAHKEIRLKEDGHTYSLNVTNISALREMAQLSQAAVKASNGIAWTSKEEADVLKKSITAIDRALEAGAYAQMIEEAPEIKDNAIVLLGICGQLHHIIQTAIDEYLGKYRPVNSELKEVKEMLAVLSQAAPTIKALHDNE